MMLLNVVALIYFFSLNFVINLITLLLGRGGGAIKYYTPLLILIFTLNPTIIPTPTCNRLHVIIIFNLKDMSYCIDTI